MKVMSLRGFQVRDYPQNFVAQMAQTTRLAFEASRQGAHSRADALVSDMLNAAAALSTPTTKVPHKKPAFPFAAPPPGLTSAFGADRSPVGGSACGARLPFLAMAVQNATIAG